MTRIILFYGVSRRLVVAIIASHGTHGQVSHRVPPQSSLRFVLSFRPSCSRSFLNIARI